MKSTIILLILVLVLPSIIQAETIFLLDGSTLNGSLVEVVGDTLFIKPSFGGAVKLPKQLIWKIQFSDSTPPGQVQTGRISAGLPGFASTEPGSLLVRFDGMKVSNKISVHRGRDPEGHERANTLESILIVDGEVVDRHIDAVTDKVIREGTDTFLKNTFEPPDFRIALPAGPHSCQLLIRNPDEPAYEDAFENARLDLKLEISNVIIYPGHTTVVPVGLKKGFLKLGERSLYTK